MKDKLIDKANKIYLQNFEPVTSFERAIFFSWYCSIADCAYCYMSTNPEKHKRNTARRTTESILAEIILSKNLSWDIGFISGGINAYSQIEFRNLLKNIYKLYKEKVWINIGALSPKTLEDYKPYIKGVVGAVETINPKIHSKVCPSKPIKPIVKMFEYAKNLELKKAITIIIGLGETIDDYNLLRDFIECNKIDKIHYYSLVPHKDTIFENAESVNPLYQAEWIAKTRVDFPKINIQAGIWVDRVENVSLLLKAGANSISKFPSIRLFNSKEAKTIENEAKKANRKFLGTLTRLPEIDVEKEIKNLEFSEEMKKRIKKKLETYLKSMGKSVNLFKNKKLLNFVEI